MPTVTAESAVTVATQARIFIEDLGNSFILAPGCRNPIGQAIPLTGNPAMESTTFFIDYFRLASCPFKVNAARLFGMMASSSSIS